MKRNRSFGKGHYSNKSVSALQRLFTGDRRTNDVPLATLRNVRKDSDGPQDPNDEELERHMCVYHPHAIDIMLMYDV